MMRYRMMDFEQKKKPGSTLMQNTQAATPIQRNATSSLQAGLLATQAGLGNHYIQRVIDSARQGGAALPIQTKLLVGPAQNEYERDADRVAAQVMSMPEITPKVQQQDEEEEDEIHARLLAATISPLVQRTVVPGDFFEPSADFESCLAYKRGGGRTLSTPTRQFMEQRFGVDFSGVRIHTGAMADQLNQELNSRAFTTGQDIFFRQGEYQPVNPGGRKLLAHELTHVVQQTGLQMQCSAESALIQRKVGDQDRIRAFLDTHVGHDNLLRGFNDSMDETAIVGQLIENFFQRTDFNYNFSTRTAFTHEGDCGVLVEEFITIARKCFGIEMASHKEERRYFIPNAQKIIHREEKRGNIDGMYWFFENHVWVVWRGMPIDVLFGQLGVVSHLAGVEDLSDANEVKYKAGDFVFYLKKDATTEFDRYTSNPLLKFRWDSS